MGYFDKLDGGLGDGKRPSDFDSESLSDGLKVEREHTTDGELALEIVMDHLTEDSQYYDKLKLIEGGMREDLVAEELVKIASLVEGSDVVMKNLNDQLSGLSILNRNIKKYGDNSADDKEVMRQIKVLLDTLKIYRGRLTLR